MKDISIQETVLDPNMNLQYGGFYLYGIKKLSKKISYCQKTFSKISDDRRNCFLFIIKFQSREYKIVIDFHDSNVIKSQSLKWCDLYAKINFHHVESIDSLNKEMEDSDLVEKLSKKIKVIPPGFGLNVFNFFEFSEFLLKIFFLKEITFLNKKTIIGSAARMYLKRLTLNEYKSAETKKNYIFHLSSIWHKEFKHININRSQFIKICKENKDIDFQGGLIDIGFPYDYIPYIKDTMFNGGKIKLQDYLEKTKESFFVFNGPSVLKCHGWKLAEYLALGKCILSTPLHNDLPYPLIHGEHIHFVEENEESMSEAVQYLLDHPEYVKKIEEGAYRYWCDYVNPEVVINNILKDIIELNE